MRYILFLFVLLILGCRTEVNKAVDTTTSTVEVNNTINGELQTPDVLLGDLFSEVQLQGVFEDGKTFVDCTAKYPYAEIKAAFENEKERTDF